MLPKQINWRSGEVVHWDLTFLDPQKPLEDQLDDLTEDLAQIRYEGRILVDIGWYPQHSKEGEFVVYVVRDSEWDEPLFEERHKSVRALLECLERATLLAEGGA